VILNVDDYLGYQMSSITMFQFPVLFCAMLYVLRSTPLFLILPRISDVIHDLLEIEAYSSKRTT
jgi:hypothetical protein